MQKPSLSTPASVPKLHSGTEARDHAPLVPAPPAGVAGSFVSAYGTAPPAEADWAPLVASLTPHCRFATLPWFGAWGETFLPFQDWLPPLRYLSIRDDAGILCAVLPLAAQRKSVVSVASLGGFYWPFRAPVVANDADSAVFDALAEALFDLEPAIAIRYGPVAKVDRSIASLNAALIRRGWRVRSSMVGATCEVELPSTWSEYEGRLGKSLRTNIRYDERRMAREGSLVIEARKGLTATEWSTTVEALGRIERQSWQHRAGGKARFVGEPNQSFWKRLLPRPTFAAMASVWVMQFEEEPVSFCFCIDCGDTRHIVANHYAEHVKGYGTGSILYQYVFRDAIESGSLRRVNLGLGDPGYKSRWGAVPSFELFDCIAFRPGVRGRLLELATRIR